MKITKLVVGKGRTFGDEKAGWSKLNFTLEILIEDSSEVEVAKAKAMSLLDDWLSTPEPAANPPAKEILGLNPDELAKLPWRTYKGKEPCKPDGAGWIFRDVKGAEVLVDLIEKQGKSIRVEIGAHTFEVKTSGTEKQFISRAAVKEKT